MSFIQVAEVESQGNVRIPSVGITMGTCKAFLVVVFFPKARPIVIVWLQALHQMLRAGIGKQKFSRFVLNYQ